MGPPCPQLKALSAWPRGTRSSSLVLGPDTAGLQVGRVESVGVLLGRGCSLGGCTCAHAAGKGLPSPAPAQPPPCWRASPGAPHLPPSPQAAPNLRPAPHAGHPRKPRGGLGSGESAAGAETAQQSKAKACPQPPARTPTPPYLVPRPACRNSLLACSLWGWVEKCDREIVVPGGRTGLDPAPGGGPAPPQEKLACTLPPVPGPLLGRGGSGGQEGSLYREDLPPALVPQLCDVRTPPLQPQFPPRPLGWGWKEAVCVQGSCRPGVLPGTQP